jgi:hypothetical protein
MKNNTHYGIVSRIAVIGVLFLLCAGLATGQDDGGAAAERAKALVQGEAADPPAVKPAETASEQFDAALLSFYDYRFVKCTYGFWSGIRLEQGSRSSSIGYLDRHFVDIFLDCEESADAFSDYLRKRRTGLVLVVGGLLSLAIYPSIISWTYDSTSPAAAWSLLLPVGAVIVDIIGTINLTSSLRDLFYAVDLYNAAQIRKRD